MSKPPETHPSFNDRLSADRSLAQADALPSLHHTRATLLSRTEASIKIKADRSLRSIPVGTSLFGGRRDLPVLGRAQGGSDGNIVIEDGAIDWTFRPADLQGVRDAFAVYVTGNSMLPKYKDKDLAYVHPGKTPRRGRYVLVETREHRGFIKQFDRWDGDILVLRQYNPAEEIRIPRADVLRILLVIGSLDG